VDGHNACAYKFKFDELLIKVIFLRFYNELKFHILSKVGKCLGVIISILSKVDTEPVLSTTGMTVK